MSKIKNNQETQEEVPIEREIFNTGLRLINSINNNQRELPDGSEYRNSGVYIRYELDKEEEEEEEEERRMEKINLSIIVNVKEKQESEGIEIPQLDIYKILTVKRFGNNRVKIELNPKLKEFLNEEEEEKDFLQKVEVLLYLLENPSEEIEQKLENLYRQIKETAEKAGISKTRDATQRETNNKYNAHRYIERIQFSLMYVKELVKSTGKIRYLIGGILYHASQISLLEEQKKIADTSLQNYYADLFDLMEKAFKKLDESSIQQGVIKAFLIALGTKIEDIIEGALESLVQIEYISYIKGPIKIEKRKDDDQNKQEVIIYYEDKSVKYGYIENDDIEHKIKIIILKFGDYFIIYDKADKKFWIIGKEENRIKLESVERNEKYTLHKNLEKIKERLQKNN